LFKIETCSDMNGSWMLSSSQMQQVTTLAWHTLMLAGAYMYGIGDDAQLT